MRTLFNLNSPVAYGTLKVAGWPYVKEGLRRNLATIVRFHRRNPQAVDSSHFLVRLLTAIGVPQSLNLDRFYENVDAVSLNTAMLLKITSPISKGTLFKGIFYGPDCPEVIIGHNEPFDIYQADKNWQNLCPVTVLRHPRSDLMMNLPDGKDTGTETGLAVILVNIPMLAIQYRAFAMEELRMHGPDESCLSVMHFIKMYVLPNMLFSHLDVALFNRIDNLQKGAPMGVSKHPHSFATVDYSRKLDVIHDEVLDYIHKKRQDFTGVLHTIPAAVHDDMTTVFNLPDLAPTRQVVWAILLSRINVLSFLFKTGRDRANTMNQSEINQVQKVITSYRSDNVLNSMLPPEYYYEVQSQLDEIFDKTKY